MKRFQPIGVIYSPFDSPGGMPVQSAAAEGYKGKIEINEEFTGGLQDLQGFSHIILLYEFHKLEGYDLHTLPFLDDKPHGIFATRSPRRPNPIGMSVVRIISVEDNRIEFDNADMINGSPLLDIKPYIPEFDSWLTDRNGWYDYKTYSIHQTRSDHRFNP